MPTSGHDYDCDRDHPHQDRTTDARAMSETPDSRAQLSGVYRLQSARNLLKALSGRELLRKTSKEARER